MAIKLQNSNSKAVVDLHKQPHLNLENYRVRPTDIYAPPVRMLAQNIDGKLYTIGTLGNISMIIGKAKAKKSFLINMMITTALNDGVSFEQLQCVAPREKRKVLYIDTEQSKDMVWRAVDRITRQIGVKNVNLDTLSLRSINPAQRLEVVELAIKQSEDVGLVIIDGISDLVTSINDEEQSTNVSTILMRLSEEYNVHIMVVLHMNKGANNDARGHLGTYFQNKAETTLSVEVDPKDEAVSNVKAVFSRDQSIKPFSIRITEDGLPIIDDDFTASTSGKKGKKTDISDTTLYEILEMCFSEKGAMSYEPLIETIQFCYQTFLEINLGISSAKILKKKGVDLGFIGQNNLKAPTQYFLTPIKTIG
jgi:hypothetical protein